jgi:hypothetical protein
MAPLYENFGRFRRASCDGLFHVLRHAVKAGELHHTWGRDPSDVWQVEEYEREV